jgi:NAD(P)-dependent dehydrogenase (short-subunit alcohol dehydrogenase family)
VVVASRKADACAETQAALEAAGAEALGVPTHLGHLEEVTALVDRTIERFGALDVLVNDAALGLALPLGELTPEAWEKVFDVNVRGPVFLAQAALPHLTASGHASVINVLSAGIFMPLPDNAMYGAAKAALLAFTRSMAAAWAPRGIRVNGLVPGPTDTDMLRGATPERRAELVRASMLGRAADPDELAGPTIFLASDASSYMTGQVLMVDGGLAPH